jgi:hypothetical protein
MSSDNDTLSIQQIVRVLSPALVETMLTRLQTEERKTYSAFMTAVATTLKFRPNSWQAWPKTRQREWLWTNLRSSRLVLTAQQLMQEWFFSERVEMLNSFLDTLGILHDEKGYIRGATPDKLDAAAVAAGVAELEKTYPAEEIALYLYLFQLGKDGGWPPITAQIARLAPAEWNWPAGGAKK